MANDVVGIYGTYYNLDNQERRDNFFQHLGRLLPDWQSKFNPGLIEACVRSTDGAMTHLLTQVHRRISSLENKAGGWRQSYNMLAEARRREKAELSSRIEQLEQELCTVREERDDAEEERDEFEQQRNAVEDDRNNLERLLSEERKEINRLKELIADTNGGDRTLFECHRCSRAYTEGQFIATHSLSSEQILGMIAPGDSLPYGMCPFGTCRGPVYKVEEEG